MPIEKINKKYSTLVNTALKLFYKKGIHAVGINEVLTESGIAKQTLYNHFASKELLVQACVIERDKRFIHCLKKHCNNTTSTVVFVEQFFVFLDCWINNRLADLDNFEGCFFVNTAAEYGNNKSEIYQLCLEHKLTIKRFVEQQLSINISNNKQLKTLTELLLLLKEGVINNAYVMGDKKAAVKAKSIALSFINNN